MKFVLILWSLTGVFCYLPPGKDSILSNIFLRDLVNRINGKSISDGDGVSYLDFTDALPLDGRSLSRELEEEQMFPLDYDGMGPLNIRDQEFLQHSTLWGKQFGGGGDGLLRPSESLKNKQDIKTETTLPAYCNPPNPCPEGFNEEQGCIVDFENTASFSRRYQAAQDCMCDTEHMFECPNTNGSLDEAMDTIDDMELNRILQNSIKMSHSNPYLSGEKLPVAAKKGNNVFF